MSSPLNPYVGVCPCLRAHHTRTQRRDPQGRAHGAMRTCGVMTQLIRYTLPHLVSIHVVFRSLSCWTGDAAWGSVAPLRWLLGDGREIGGSGRLGKKAGGSGYVGIQR